MHNIRKFLFSKLERSRYIVYSFIEAARLRIIEDEQDNIFGRSRSGYDRIYIRFGTCKRRAIRLLFLQNIGSFFRVSTQSNFIIDIPTFTFFKYQIRQINLSFHGKFFFFLFFFFLIMIQRKKEIN